MGGVSGQLSAALRGQDCVSQCAVVADCDGGSGDLRGESGSLCVAVLAVDVAARGARGLIPAGFWQRSISSGSVSRWPTNERSPQESFIKFFHECVGLESPSEA